jgi:hypothetical protein
MAYTTKPKKGTPEPLDHGTLCEWVNEYEDATQESRAISEKCRDYNDSKQWTGAEAAALERRGQAAVVINRIKPKNDGLLGLEKTQRTTAKAFPRTPKHEGGADAATQGIRFVLDDQAFPQTRSAAFDNMIVEGTGGCEVIMKESDDGFRVIINHIQWDRMFWDPHSRRKDFSDAKYLGQIKWMDYEDAAYEFDRKDMLEEMLGSASDTFADKPKWIDSKRRRVKVCEIYYWHEGECFYSCFTRGGMLTEPKISAYKNEDGETEWPYVFQSAFVDRDGGRYGADKQLLDVQDEINKRRSKALHLMSVRQVRWERGAVEDINKARQELAKPDGVLETTPGMEFEILKTGDMAAAQFNLLTEAKQEIDAVGYNAAVSGKDENAISGVALKQRAMAGQTELAPLFDGLKHFDYRVYRKVWNRIKQSWTGEKWIRVTDDPNTVKWVGLNTPMKDPYGMTVPGLDGQPQIENDVATLDVDIVISDAPDAVTTQIEDFQVLGEMVKSGFPMPPEAVILASPLSHKDRILKMMQEAKQQQVPPQIQEAMQKMQEEGQKLQQENQALKQDQSTQMAKLQADSAAKNAEMTMKAEIQARELELEQAKINAQIELERAKAAAQIEIEQIKLQAQTQQTQQKMDFDRECKMMDMGEEAKKQVLTKQVAEVDLLPGVLKTLSTPLEEISAALKTLIDLQQQTLEAFSRPRIVSLSGVKRDSAGHITSANVNPTLQ